MKFWNHGILGINARNLHYIKPFNKKKAVHFADDKLKTKAFLTARGIPAAKIFARLDNREQLYAFDFTQLPDECVLKPNFGYGGEGIWILNGRNKKGRFMRNGKTEIFNQELEEHIEDILEGKYSLGGHLDTAFFEQILHPHPCFAKFRPVGLPDIRVIVFNLIPVMAMLRVPTAASDGKANLHLGGLGIGLDIAKGVTTSAAQYHSILTELPHGGNPSGIEVPYWDDILQICSKIQHITNIGYLAVDITIDEQLGPALLEVNARAGLNVQIANLSPLRSRLERVKGLTVGSPEKGVQIAKDLFGRTSKKTTPAPVTEKPILGTHETISIAGTGSAIEAPALIAPQRERTIVDTHLIEKLLSSKKIESAPESENSYRLKFTLRGKKITTLVTAETIENPTVQVVIGKRDLTGFLIDPSKQSEETVFRSTEKTDLRAVDNVLGQLDRDLVLIKALKPLNLEEERVRLQEDDRYNPTFVYPDLKVDLNEARKKLLDPLQDDSPLGQLLEKKREELLTRIDLIEARGKGELFTESSENLYGTVTDELLREAEVAIAQRASCALPPSADKLRTAEVAREEFEKALKRYSLHNWKVVIRDSLVADCTVGGTSIFIRSDALLADDHIASLIKHEIETHVLTAENGTHQPYSLLRRGTAGYLDTQEGLAVYNQNSVLPPDHEKQFNPCRHVLGLQFAKGNSLAALRSYLREELGYTDKKAMSTAISMKRGLSDTSEPGGFTRSIVYFRGQRKIEDFVKQGGDLRRLYIGKINIDDLELTEKVEGLLAPLLLPEFLRDKS